MPGGFPVNNQETKWYTLSSPAGMWVHNYNREHEYLIFRCLTHSSGIYHNLTANLAVPKIVL